MLERSGLLVGSQREQIQSNLCRPVIFTLGSRVIHPEPLVPYQIRKILTMRPARLACFALVLAVCGCSLPETAHAFLRDACPRSRRSLTAHRARPDSDDTPAVVGRFVSPQIDDPRLPAAEAALCQMAGPALELAYLRATGAPRPSWAGPSLSDPIFASAGAVYLDQVLVHGAGLAACWVAGVVAVRGYERSTYADGVTAVEVAQRAVGAGAVAAGLLMAGVGVDLLWTMGGLVLPGESAGADSTTQMSLVEAAQDIFFEGVTMLSWRLYLWKREEAA